MGINIKSVFVWSDSKPDLNYLRNTETNFGSYIMRRCSKIRLNTRIDDWKCIPCEINRTNFVLRGIPKILYRVSLGIPIEKYYSLKRWFTGPEFFTFVNPRYDFESHKTEDVTGKVSVENVNKHECHVNISMSNQASQASFFSSTFW